MRKLDGEWRREVCSHRTCDCAPTWSCSSEFDPRRDSDEAEATAIAAAGVRELWHFEVDFGALCMQCALQRPSEHTN
jgi:hypothetical protein